MSYKYLKQSKKVKGLMPNDNAIFTSHDGQKYEGKVKQIFIKPVIPGLNKMKNEYVLFEYKVPGDTFLSLHEIRSDWITKKQKPNLARITLNRHTQSKKKRNRKPLRISIRRKKNTRPIKSSPLPKTSLKSGIRVSKRKRRRSKSKMNNIKKAAFNNNWGQNNMLGDPYNPQNIY